MVKKINLVFISMLLIVTMFSIVDASETTIGTKKLDDCIDLIQTCADCTYVNFTSYTYPNGTRIVWEVEGVKESVSFTYYNCSLTNQLGAWIVDGHGDVGGKDTVFSYTYEVTSTGKPTPDGMPMFQMGLIIIIFGISCFLLYLSFVMNEVGFKIFFMIASLIFLMSTMLSAYMISVDGNVAASINSTTLGLITVLGAIIFIVFVFILIRQTVTALDLFKIKKGLKMQYNTGAKSTYNVGAGSDVSGYNNKKAY